LKTQIDAQIPDSLLTTTGDIIYASGASTPARLGIGTTGQALVVSGGLPTWATPTSASDNFAFISTTSVSGSTITISGLSGKNALLIYLNALVSTTTSQQIAMRINADTGTNYRLFGATNNSQIDTSTTDRVKLMGNTTQSNQDLLGVILIQGANAAGYKPLTVGTGSVQVNAAETGMGFYAGTSVVSSITLFTTGTFSSGSVSIYGAN
jgi:hypothetical protein